MIGHHVFSNIMYFCTSVRFLPIPQSVHHSPLIYYYNYSKRATEVSKNIIIWCLIIDSLLYMYYGATSICNMNVCNMYITHLDTYTYMCTVTHN